MQLGVAHCTESDLVEQGRHPASTFVLFASLMRSFLFLI